MDSKIRKGYMLIGKKLSLRECNINRVSWERTAQLTRFFIVSCYHRKRRGNMEMTRKKDDIRRNRLREEDLEDNVGWGGK